MKHSFFTMVSLSALLLGFACTNSNSKSNAGSSDSTKAKDSTAKTTSNTMLGDKIGTKGDISIYVFQGSPDFPDATLSYNTPLSKGVSSGAKVSFDFGVKNYELKQQTSGHDACNCNNSAKGQHIHLILNNQPYKPLYSTKFDTALKDGRYLAVSFLSRSFHESVKNKNAFQVATFDVGKVDAKPIDLKSPMLVYSRPKGEYKGKDADIVLLDFYLINTDLSETGNKVAATINGEQFMLSKWCAYAIKGLKVGKNTIKLELVDNEGKIIDGPYNTVERTITIKE